MAGLIAGAAALGLGRLALAGGRAVGARPILYGGSAAFLALGATVSANALFHQTTVHPQPMLVTRTVDALETASAGPRTEPAVARPWRPTNDPRIQPVPMVREAQELLQKAGYYQAEIDGRPGQATDRAIRRFQAERGLRVDGMTTPLLLTQIRQLTGDVPTPSGAPEGREYAGLDDLLNDLPADGSDIPILDEEPADPELVKRIQAGLTSASVAELKADGIAGSATRAAIRTFQELEGLEVTGMPSESLLAHLDQMAR